MAKTFVDVTGGYIEDSDGDKIIQLNKYDDVSDTLNNYSFKQVELTSGQTGKTIQFDDVASGTVVKMIMTTSGGKAKYYVNGDSSGYIVRDVVRIEGNSDGYLTSLIMDNLYDGVCELDIVIGGE